MINSEEVMNSLRLLLKTESEWNPKVMLGRVATAVFPESALNAFKKQYYGYLITHMAEEWMESDAVLLPFLVGPGDCAVDVGANLGMYSRRLAKLVGPSGHVYAFEPIPQTYDFLCHNLKKLRLPQIEALPYGLSDSQRNDVMVIPHYRWGSECWYDARIKTDKAKPNWREIKIQTRTLDSFSLPRISFIKCDANFHELFVLRGAVATLEGCRPAMLIEVNPNPDDPTTTAYQTFALLRDLGYGVYCQVQGNLVRRKKGQRSQNYFFLTPQQEEKVLTGLDQLSAA